MPKITYTLSTLSKLCPKYELKYWCDDTMWEVMSATHRIGAVRENQKWWRFGKQIDWIAVADENHPARIAIAASADENVVKRIKAMCKEIEEENISLGKIAIVIER